MGQQVSSSTRIVHLSGTESDQVFSAIETLHRAELSAGALAHMPQGFLCRFYKYVASQHDFAVLGALDGARLVGFVCGSMADARLSKLVGRFALADPRTATATAVRLIASPTGAFRLMRLVGSLVRDRGQGQIRGPQLLSLAVDGAEVARGFGRQLFENLSSLFSRSGVRAFTVVAAHTQVAALAFYERQGCNRVAQVELGGLPCTVFRCPVLSSRDSETANQTH